MLFDIRHRTSYHYSAPVRLGPQLLRFHPRLDGAQHIVDHRLAITPAPCGCNDHLDLEGNLVTQAWFEGATDSLVIEVAMRVQTLRHEAIDFILAPAAVSCPVDYAADTPLARNYLQRTAPETSVDAFAAACLRAAGGNTLRFLQQLTGALYRDFTRMHRETGAPQTPVDTLHRRRGACRDLTVLFVDCCRSLGIAARFASGYQKGDLQRERRFLHAWPEVYLPGAGWRGYDPTHGEAVADTHVTIAAAADPANTMPVSGTFAGGDVESRLDYQVDIRVDEG